MTKILVVYYSMYGNTFQLAQAVADGAKKVDDTRVSIKRVADLIPPEKIEKIPGASDALKAQSEIEIANPKDLDQYDGIIFGSPTRFGNQCAQMKNFIDNTWPNPPNNYFRVYYFNLL